MIANGAPASAQPTCSRADAVGQAAKAFVGLGPYAKAIAPLGRLRCPYPER
jgi:hypothetical protein